MIKVNFIIIIVEQLVFRSGGTGTETILSDMVIDVNWLDDDILLKVYFDSVEIKFVVRIVSQDEFFRSESTKREVYFFGDDFVIAEHETV